MCEVNWHAETSRFPSDIAKEVVLQRLVVRIAGNTSLHMMGVDATGVGVTSRFEVERTQVGGFELDGHRAIFLLQFQQWGHDGCRILRQRCRKRIYTQLLQVTLEQEVFPAVEDLAVGRLSCQRRIVQRKQEDIVEGYPTETRRLETWPESDAVGQLRLDPQLIQHPVRIVFAFPLLHLLLSRQ